MNLALREAWKYQGLTYPNPAVGCTIIDENGALLAVEAHKKAGFAHAEVLALQNAYYKLTDDSSILELESSTKIHEFLLKNHNNCFKNITLYTTLEPCSHVGKTPSCASLISSLGVKKVYIGFNDINDVASGGTAIMKEFGVDVKSGVLARECEDLITPFNRWSKERFVFFKWAQRLDGSTDGSVSSLKSRKHVHAMRNLCDLLVIGGNTVREDRPTLDARLVDGKAPDILIISRKKEFDKTIPLFKVPNREVFIESDFARLDSYNNIMIEGTKKLFELSKQYVDCYLSYVVTPLDVLNIEKEDKDIIMWMKREI
jgi:diaminohydroxyphosphoribosylaminopyrimidine deaminase/5-amino-6-(5-phosphoribosylamino)uracil reductase